MTTDGTPASPPPEGSGETGSPEEIPWGQKLYDRPFLLLIAGIVIMFICYTGWGLWEIASLEQAPLP